MRYRLVYTHRASKDIRRLEENVKQRIGDYRVIFDIEDKEIVVLRVGHRRDIYRKL